MNTEISAAARPPRIIAVLSGLMGFALLYGGGLLLIEGGSAYYLIAGAAAVVAAVLLWRGSAVGAWMFGALTFGTVAWAFWESGADLWALLPRVWPFLALGGFLLLPPLRRKLGMISSAGKAWVLALVGLVASAGLGLALHHATGLEIEDPALARGTVPVQAPVANAQAASWGGDWRFYGNDPGGSRFSPLTQIDTGNVDELEVAWTYRVGSGVDKLEANLEMTPIKVGDSVYLCTPFDDVVALDAVSGREKWRYHSHTDRHGWVYKNCRGVTFNEVAGTSGTCSRRIYSTDFAGRLFALDAETGALCPDFGEKGYVNLRKGLSPHDHPGYYYPTSAPALVRGNLVLGGWVADGQKWGSPSGVIRAFDAVTGKLAWAWDMGRPDRKGEPPEGEYYTPSTPNSWAPMSVDPEMGLVFAPTGNASGADYYGAQRRSFDDQYSGAVVALDGATGDVRWAFQTTHHDIWDYDVASQPSLVDVPTASGVRKAVIQPTKRAQLFVLDRATGQPIKQALELPVPTDGAPGERVSPTQPYSTGMPDLGGPRLKERMMWGLSPFDQLWCRIEFRKSRYHGDFTPPVLDKWSLVYPGYGGGQNWGSTTYDLDRGLLISNTTRMANRVQLATREEADAAGIKPMSGQGNADIGGFVGQTGTRFAAKVAPFLSPLQTPCQQPPYGVLTAIDLASGKVAWQREVGSAEAAGPLGTRSYLPLPMGMPMFGGSIATRSGLIFMAATKDEAIRAFDTRTGETLWQRELPAGGQAVPMTYMGADGRQYVVIAASGHYGTASRRGDYIIAFALPRRR